MSARRLTGQALADVLGKAAEAAIGGAVERSADRLQSAITSVDEGLNAPSSPWRGRAGEGAFLSPPPEGELGPQGRERVYGRSGEDVNPLPSASPPTSPSGRSEARAAASRRRSAILTLSAPNLFAHEFGSLATPADPILAPAIARLKRRPR